MTDSRTFDRDSRGMACDCSIHVRDGSRCANASARTRNASRVAHDHRRRQNFFGATLVNDRQRCCMDKSKRRRYESQVRVRAFCTDHPSIFSGSPAGRKLLAAHVDVVTKLTEYFAAQSSGHTAEREGTTSRAESRDILRGAIESVSWTSRLLDTERVGDRFPMPQRASDRQLVAGPRSM